MKELKAERDSLLNLNSRMVLRQKQYSEELDSMRYLANATQAHIDKIKKLTMLPKISTKTILYTTQLIKNTN